MSDLFSDTLIDIDVYYVVEKNKAGHSQVIILDDQKAAAMKADEKTKDKVQTLKTKWKSQAWDVANDVLSKSMVFNHLSQSSDLDWIRYRDSRLKSCLVEWSAKGEKGESIPCNATNINKLHASVALALIEKYDIATQPDRVEIQKNS